MNRRISRPARFPERQVAVQHTAISLAISAALFGGSLAAQEAAQGEKIEEILVTASRRTESLQDVAFSIKALGNDEIQRRRLQGIDDYARFLPTMSYFANSPGAAKIVFRGVSDAPIAFIAQSSASLYLDEQPLTQNFNVDVRMVDIERLEALSGPQGTLYGDSSQSGTLRIITNKPDPTQFSANVGAMLRSGSKSSMSHELTAVANIPLVEDKLAIRLVGFTSKDGGFIDNVLGPTPRFGQSDNADVVEDNWNDFTVSGARVSARWFVNEDWTATGSIVYQDSEADALQEHDPTVGDLEVVRFFAEPRDDEWEQFGLTLEGRIGNASLISNTAYFERDVSYINDRTTYASYFSLFCNGPYDPSYNIQYAPAYCYGGPTVDTNDPRNFNTYLQRNTRFTQELRLSGSTGRWDWLIGAFYEDKTEEWDYRTVVGPNYRDTIAYAYWAGLYTLPPNVEAWWNSGDDTKWEQWAVFGETSFKFDERWTLTLGGRYYDTTFDKTYFVERPDGRLDAASNPGGNPPGFSNPEGSDSGFLPKVSLKYDFDPDKMIYGLYSEGFRAGGTNRGRGDPNRVVVPFTYDADIVENWELGFKSRFAGGRVQFNATAFHMLWKDAQFEFNDPSFNFSPSEPFQTVVGNAFDAVNDGIEVALNALVGDNVELGLSAAYIEAETDSAADVCSTAAPELQAECRATFIPIPEGSRLPLTPKFKGAGSLQYNFPMWGRDAYVLGQVSYTGSSVNQLQESTLDDGPAPQLKQSSYTIADVSLGLRDADWEATLFINNLTDERANLFSNPFYFDYFWGRARQSVNRPREFGVRFTYHWN